MFLKVTKQKSGKVSLAFVEGFRDAETKKIKHRVVKNLGYLEQHLDVYDDPIAHFKEIARERTEFQRQENGSRVYNLGDISSGKKIDPNEDALKYLGFLPLSYIYHQLKMNEFWINRQKNFDLSYSLNDVMQLLVYMKILSPDSKESVAKDKASLPFNINCGECDISQAFDIFERYKDDFLLHVHEEVRSNYGRKTDCVFYDLTNHNLDIDRDDSRKKKAGRHNKRDTSIKMGLLLDNNALPVTYELFEGGASDNKTAMPSLQETRDKYDIKKLVTVADRGLNSGDDFASLMAEGDGFIFSHELKKDDRELRDYMFDSNGYKTILAPNPREKIADTEDRIQYKSRLYPREFLVDYADNPGTQIPIVARQIICYSEQYAKEQKYRRRKAIRKAVKIIENPDRLKSDEDTEVLRYIGNLDIDTKTTERTETEKILFLNEERIKEDERYDGFYIIITSELGMADLEVVEQYHNLWKIERNFGINKGELQSRPAYVSVEKHIRAHFLISFTALLILRLLCMNIDNRFSPEQVVESLRKSKVCFIKDNLYRNTYFDEVLGKIQEKMDLELDRKYFAKGDIRTVVARTKKH